MPRRRKPPATTREIGAYLAGCRLAQVWFDTAEGAQPDRSWRLARLAATDAELLASMDAARFWSCLDQGWDDELVRKAFE